jgi:hypothetical protein
MARNVNHVSIFLYATIYLSHVESGDIQSVLFMHVGSVLIF